MDIFDATLHYSELAKKKKIFPVVYDYPETIQKILWIFVSTWGIPEEGVPPKPRSGKGEYAEWISEIVSIESLLGSKPEETMQRALALYGEMKMNFMVVRPRAIRNLLIDLKRREATNSENIKKRKTFSEFMNTYEGDREKADPKTVAKDLKNLLK